MQPSAAAADGSKTAAGEGGKFETDLQRSWRQQQRACAVVLTVVVLMGLSAFGAWRLQVANMAAGSGVAAEFEAFTTRFGRSYSPEERDVRYAIFQANYRFVQAENAKGLPYRLGMNEFADLTAQEFRAGHLGFAGASGGGSGDAPWGELPHLGTDRLNATAAPTDLPIAVDWPAQGAVTTPKNQLHCGACWAFATTGALEGAWKIASGELVSLSEQQLVDCDKVDNACGGGLMDQAFKYARGHGICTEQSYPYQAQSAACRASNCSVAMPPTAVQGFRDVAAYDEQALMHAVSKQPVAVAIEADQLAFQLYSGGVLSQECGDKLDHGVLLVGYGTENGTDYWKVKNSWGSSWGEGGFIRMKRGVKGSGQCGITSAPSYPIVRAERSAVAAAAASIVV